jgi:phosphohistidine phosphatase SixA
MRPIRRSRPAPSAFTLGAAGLLFAALSLAPPARALGGTDEPEPPPPAAAATALDPSPAAATSLDALAERYVDLALALGKHDPDYVDAWFGAAERRTAVEARGWDLATIASRAKALEAELATSPRPGDPQQAWRHSFLQQQVHAMATRAAMVGGATLRFDDETRALYGVVAPHYDAAYFEGLLAELEPLLPPGEGSVAARWDAWRSRFVIPPDKVDTVFRAAIAACRERTLARFELPAGESFTVEYVTDKPWSGYNWYQGNYRSVIQVNVDLPITIDRAVDLACHEGYPGHHVYNVLHEQRLVRERGWQEHQVQPLYAPQALMMEGSANHGVVMAFPGDERVAFEQATLFPLAGLDPAEAPAYYRAFALTQRLSHAGNQAARGLLDGTMDAEAAADWHVRYGLYSPERAKQRIGFIEKYRGYVVNYNVGRDLVAAWLDVRTAAAGGSEEARWRAFEELLAEPILPAEVLADLPAGVSGTSGDGAAAAGTTAAPSTAAESSTAAAAGVLAYLVRHAEKDAAGGDDPPLSAAGTARADRLADLLGGEGIRRILVTDTRRARDTAAPIAARLGLTPEIYDHRRLPELAAELRQRGERVLVVGHSNTTGVLAGHLGGDPGSPIGDGEYDRLYRVDLATGATTLTRY